MDHPPKDTVADTIAIVQKFCGSCHLVPGPELLDKKTWNYKLLPNMGYRLGIVSDTYNPIIDLDMMDQTLVLQSNIYPSKPLLSHLDWKKINDYYEDHAPDSLSVSNYSSIDLEQFAVIAKGNLVPYPRITLLHFDPLHQAIHIGMESGKILSFTPGFELVDSFDLKETPLDYTRDQNQNQWYLSAGRMYPTEQKLGSLFLKSGDSLRSMVKGLHRPVGLLLADMNMDKHLDAIISEFGYETGRLVWYEGTSLGFKSVPHILNSLPGTVKTVSQDMDGDGRQDLVALHAQGDEHVSIYKMDDTGHWKDHRVLRFQPVHGSCDIDLVDMNLDGKTDIVVSNGDNADYTQITKPYHGIRIYLNKGNLHFEESVFIPYPGILHSVVHDFDQDGDMDIAAVSFFPGDQKQTVNAFTYFEQKETKFISRSFPESNFGKWMTITTGDIDYDGDEDIILGSFLLNNYLVLGTRADQKKYAIIVLKNKLKSAH